MRRTLEHIQVGDQVLYKAFGKLKILIVTKITKTTIVCDRLRFRRTDGRTIPIEKWAITGIEELTEETMKSYELAAKRNMLIHKCNTAPYNLLPTEILEEISNLIDNVKL